MIDQNTSADWFREYYFSYKGLRPPQEREQGQRLACILSRYVEKDPLNPQGCGPTSNLFGIMTEIAANGILRLLTYPRFELRFSNKIEDNVGADLIVHEKGGMFAIDTKMGKPPGPIFSKKLQMPLISLSFPKEKTGIEKIISHLGEGEYIDPNEFYREVGLDGLHQCGMLGYLQTTAGWILRDRLFTRSSGKYNHAKDFLNDLLLPKSQT